jgi:hypothetical protein
VNQVPIDVQQSRHAIINDHMIVPDFVVQSAGIRGEEDTGRKLITSRRERASPLGGSATDWQESIRNREQSDTGGDGSERNSHDDVEFQER